MTARKRDIDRKAQAGFTLIELIAVIVILGILATVAVPKYIDLQKEARAAAVKGLAGNLGSAAALNYAAEVAGNASAVSLTKCAEITNVANVDSNFATAYTLTDTSTGAKLGDTFTCTIVDAKDSEATATFTGIYVP
ncbi:pilin [Desulfocurvibacter africanus]|uniref:pilin n=1 Tax=Desulfocurvibacter africanus TaxID=873 RepID=UPI0006849390|nr:prepilin-type N-terminal cleavage/methylation domain-containing protein [Desulfocurvibacter africanus]